MLKYSKIKPNCKNTLPPTQSSEFSTRPAAKRVDRAFLWLHGKIHPYFMKTKWLPINLWHFTASGCPVNTFSYVHHDLSNNFHSPKPLPCVRVFQQPAQNTKNSAKFDEVAALYWFHFRSGRGLSIDLGMGKCSYLLGKKGASLRALAQNAHEILARELVSTYEVKIPAK